MNKLNLTFFFNIVSFSFLTWINHRGNEVGSHNIYLSIIFFNGNTWKVRNDRLLTNNDHKCEIGQNVQSDNITLPGEKNTLKDITGSSEIHENIKKNTSNSIYTYIKQLEKGYPNKKGLKSLDCYYEKKLFNEMYKLDKVAGPMKSRNSYFKKVIWKRYGLRFVIFSLVILFGISVSIWGYISSIDDSTTNITCKTNGENLCIVCKNMGNFLPIPNIVLFFPLTIAYLSFVIYIFSKVKKYKRLKRKYDKGLFRKSLENIYKNDKTLDIKFNRLLAKHELQRELGHTRLREKFPNTRLYKNVKTVSDDLFTYSRVKRKASNNIDTYMKNYKDRYMKKKGISKLDCYYENKLFRKFCHISDIANKMQYDKKGSKKFFFKKYGIGLIIFALIPTLGFISPILFGIGKHSGIYSLCKEKHFHIETGKHLDTGKAAECPSLWLYKEDVTTKCVSYIPSIFSFVTIIIVLSVIFYMLIKVMKYENIKAGKVK